MTDHSVYDLRRSKTYTLPMTEARLRMSSPKAPAGEIKIFERDSVTTGGQSSYGVEKKNKNAALTAAVLAKNLNI